ncbi:hypothetical protein Acr_08g0013050 [Actinidia rufa]|uniref:Uncharacterized protein n=1 Tax=Actinidia rufa TaxID=165716 RepID=A0A7J0F3T8_9ERIC|nr:hypothetical protein Acr_08g0013050 [Actinidia rufa]
MTEERFEASGGTLRVSKRNNEMLWGKEETRGLYQLEGRVQTGGATIRHESNGISKKNRQGKQQLHRDMYKSLSRHEWCNQYRISREKLKEEEDKVDFEELYSDDGSMPPKRVYLALDLISSGDLSSCAHKGGEMEPRQLAKVTYFVAHPGGGCRAHQCGGAYTSDGQLEDIGLPSNGLEEEIIEFIPPG